MSKAAEAQELCACQLIKRTDGLVWCCTECHRYWKNDKRLTSVSKVTNALLPTDFSGINPVVLECARLRGIFVDTYFCEWLADPLNVMPLADVVPMVAPKFPERGEQHAADTVQRIERLLEWWQKSGMRCLATQKVVHSEVDGVAGMMDLSTDRGIFDLKCVSELRPVYALQLGAYASYDDLAPQGVGIIHVQKDRIKMVPYDPAKVRRQWRAAVDWFNTAKELQ